MVPPAARFPVPMQWHRLTCRPVRIEWPTVAVAVCIYAGFAALTWWYDRLPPPLVAVLGGYLLAWHGSLQHEVIHGHPTPWRAVNELLARPGLSLWLPFGLYRDSHLAHHRAELTCPQQDPESWYLSPRAWASLGAPGRTCLHLLNTSVGRLVLGPLVLLWRFAATQLRAARGGTLDAAAWAGHALATAPVLAWVLWVCRIPLGEYLLLFVYPYLALTLLRTFAEHQAEALPGQRTSAVETHPLMALVYLNNNLHALHHECPRVAWYRLPRLWRRHRARILQANGGHCYPGYLTVLWRYALRPRVTPCWPLAAPASSGAPALPAPAVAPR